LFEKHETIEKVTGSRDDNSFRNRMISRGSRKSGVAQCRDLRFSQPATKREAARSFPSASLFVAGLLSSD
jgi:hypothetical protein